MLSSPLLFFPFSWHVTFPHKIWSDDYIHVLSVYTVSSRVLNASAESFQPHMRTPRAAQGRHSAPPLDSKVLALNTDHSTPWPHTGQAVISNFKSKLTISKSTSLNNCVPDTFLFTVSSPPAGHLPQSCLCFCQHFQSPNVASSLQLCFLKKLLLRLLCPPPTPRQSFNNIFLEY